MTCGSSKVFVAKYKQRFLLYAFRYFIEKHNFNKNGNSLFEIVTDKSRIRHCLSDARTTYKPWRAPCRTTSLTFHAVLQKVSMIKITLNIMFFLLLIHEINFKPPYLNN